MTRKRGKAAVIDALITSGGFGDFGNSSPKIQPGVSKAAPDVVRSRGVVNETSTSNSSANEKQLPGNISTEGPNDNCTGAPRISARDEVASTIMLAGERSDIGPIQAIHRKVMVVDSISQLPGFNEGMLRMFVPCEFVKPWSLHDRLLVGDPDISDIYESILSEGQEEPCITRLNAAGDGIELIAGYRRFCAVQNTSSAYLLIDLYQLQHLTDKTAWIEMTRENNLDRKKCIPISAQVQSDQKALAQGIFKNLSELSKAAGKAENWARQNKHLYDQIPERIRMLCTTQQLATLTAPHYRKIGKLLKDGKNWRDDRIGSIVSEWDKLSEHTDKFPLKQIESLLEARSSDVKALSCGAVKVRVDHNGNINLTVSRGLSHQQISDLVKTVQSTIESL
jgi:hypothetical protein